MLLAAAGPFTFSDFCWPLSPSPSPTAVDPPSSMRRRPKVLNLPLLPPLLHPNPNPGPSSSFRCNDGGQVCGACVPGGRRLLDECEEPTPDPTMLRPPSDSCGRPARKQCQRKAWCGLRPRHGSLDCNTGLSIQNREVLENRSSSPLERFPESFVCSIFISVLILILIL